MCGAGFDGLALDDVQSTGPLRVLLALMEVEHKVGFN